MFPSTADYVPSPTCHAPGSPPCLQRSSVATERWATAPARTAPSAAPCGATAAPGTTTAGEWAAASLGLRVGGGGGGCGAHGCVGRGEGGGGGGGLLSSWLCVSGAMWGGAHFPTHPHPSPFLLVQLGPGLLHGRPLPGLHRQAHFSGGSVEWVAASRQMSYRGPFPPLDSHHPHLPSLAPLRSARSLYASPMEQQCSPALSTT